MYHKHRWTPEKIQKRLNLIVPMVYIRRSALPPFRYLELTGPEIPPPVTADVDDSSSSPSFVSTDSPTAIIETIKCAEDGDGIIVRLYESQKSGIRYGCGLGLGCNQPG